MFTFSSPFLSLCALLTFIGQFFGCIWGEYTFIYTRIWSGRELSLASLIIMSNHVLYFKMNCSLRIMIPCAQQPCYTSTCMSKLIHGRLACRTISIAFWVSLRSTSIYKIQHPKHIQQYVLGLFLLPWTTTTTSTNASCVPILLCFTASMVWWVETMIWFQSIANDTWNTCILRTWHVFVATLNMINIENISEAWWKLQLLRNMLNSKLVRFLSNPFRYKETVAQ